MNYCDKIDYRILLAEKDQFPAMVDKLLTRLPENKTVFRLAFFGMPADNEEYLTRHAILKQKIAERFTDKKPAWSYVSQPPLNAPLILEVQSYRVEPEDEVLYKEESGFPYVVLQNPQGRFLFAGGFQSDILNRTIEQQSWDVFKLIDKVLKKEEFPANDIIRQWNYIQEITAFEGENQNYQSFNNARGDFYSTVTWQNGYPAATGIGANLGGILVDLDAVVFTSPDAYATPIDNKLQIAAHAYSDQVLEVAQCKKATPKFERAKSITFGNKRLVYISGTAAIRGEESLTGVGLERQLHITMENIYQLIGEAKIEMLRVYLKYREDYPEAEKLMKEYYPDMTISYMCADVCRDELLIEIEGIAIEK